MVPYERLHTTTKAMQLLGIVSTVVALLVLACNRTRSPGADDFSSLRFSVVEVVDPYESRNPLNQPPAGTRHVALRLGISNVSEATVTVEPAVDFALETERRATLEPATLVDEPEDISAGGPRLGVLAPGEQLTGLLFFDVPLGDRPATLVLRLDGGSAAEPIDTREKSRDGNQ